MNSFNKTNNEYERFQDEFSKSIRDNFGASVHNEGLEPIAQSLEALCMQENKIAVETVNIQRTIHEARSILRDSGA